MIYTTDMLVNKFNAYTNPKAKIKRMCNNGELINVCHGLYEDDKNADSFLLHSYIYGPSYISFDYVLSMYSIIPEFGLNVTCATFGKEKNKLYNTPFGIILYRDVPKKVFPYGTQNISCNGYNYILASPEKALCDFLYSKSYQAVSLDDFVTYMFDDLRIDEVEFLKLDFTFIKEIAPLYKKSNLNYLVEYILKEELVC